MGLMKAVDKFDYTKDLSFQLMRLSGSVRPLPVQLLTKLGSSGFGPHGGNR